MHVQDTMTALNHHGFLEMVVAFGVNLTVLAGALAGAFKLVSDKVVEERQRLFDQQKCQSDRSEVNGELELK